MNPPGSKGFAISKTVFYYIGVLLFVMGLVFLIAGFRTESASLDDASKEIVSATTLHRLVSSEDCFSSGDAGTLSVNKIEEWASSGGSYGVLEPECASIPNAGFDLTIRDERRDNVWGDYGYDYPGGGIVDQTSAVAEYDDGARNPVNITYRFSYKDNDLLLYIMDQASRTWYTNETIVTSYNNVYQEAFPKGESSTMDNDEGVICSSRTADDDENSEKRCKRPPGDFEVRICPLGPDDCGRGVLYGTERSQEILTELDGNVVTVRNARVEDE